MHKVSELYKQIRAGDYTVEPLLIIDGVEYDIHSIYKLRTYSSVFSGGNPGIGGTVSSEIDISVLKPHIPPKAQAKIVLKARIVDVADKTRVSEWIPKGTYYIDTRSADRLAGEASGLVIHGFDSMIFAERAYDKSSLSWPAIDINVVKEIAMNLGITVEPETISKINRGFSISLPSDYSYREVLGYIAVMYNGAFVISEDNQLRLIQLGSIPEETYYLTTNSGDSITFGGVRILV